MNERLWSGGSERAEPQRVQADGQGVLRFDAPVGLDHRTRVRLQGS